MPWRKLSIYESCVLLAIGSCVYVKWNNASSSWKRKINDWKFFEILGMLQLIQVVAHP